MATITAASASYADVNTALGLCSGNDTLQVPDGSATWASQLSLSIGIKLEKLGSGVITGATGASTPLIYFHPNAALNEIIEIMGFNFDCNNNCPWLKIELADNTNYLTKVRIHHNTILNIVVSATEFIGKVWGCYDHNIETGECHHDVYGLDDYPGLTDWADTTFGFGNQYSMYFEDNTWTTSYPICTGG